MIAIWGANGFIGRHLTHHLAYEGRDLKLFARNYDGFPFSLLTGTRSFTADFTKPGEYIGDLRDCRTIVLLVSVSRPRMGGLDIQEEIRQNVEPYKNFFAALQSSGAQAERIIYLSSGGAIYGKTEAKPVSENHSLNPINAYGHAKVEIEKLIQEHKSRGAGWDYTILRVANPAGAWSKSGLVYRALHCALSGQSMDRLGDGEIIRDYFDVRELTEVIALSIDSPKANNEIFNVGSGLGLTINQVIDIVEKITGKAIKLNLRPANPDDVAYNVLECVKIKKALGWGAKNDLQSIVRTMWDAQ